jgi:stearoyl-CoA desaturase (delta-9 desaturase)
LVGLSVCAGYHRCFSHRSYESAKGVQLFYAIFGAFAAQNSVLQWSSGHRRHHVHVDSDWDPYSINRGFWWAHILWVFYVDPESKCLDNVRDLQASAILRWQHRWYKTLLIGGGFGLPLLAGAFFGDPVAGLLWGGFLRIAAVHHSTFFVNSLSHTVGSRTYNPTGSARDNWAVAFMTFGEGFHSFHHRFPGDFRNGIRWFAWDPAKWFIRALQGCRLAANLRTTADPVIEQARLQAEVKRLEARIAQVEPSRGAAIRARIERARVAFEAAIALWRKQMEERRQGLKDRWRVTRRAYRLRLRQARLEWRCLRREVRSS